jgi:hypothetical protein
MTDCDSCGRAQLDTAYVCTDCAKRLMVRLHWLAANCAELDVTISRQARLGERSGRGMAETPLPIDLAASYDRDAVRNVLTTWARDIVEARGIAPPADDIASIATWLAGHVLGWLRFRAYAAEAMDELDDAVALVHRVVDSRGQRVYRGPCSTPIRDSDAMCDADLYGPLSADWITCRACGAEHDSAARREWLLDQVRDQLVPAVMVSAALTTWAEVPPSYDAVRKWIERGHLLARGYTLDGRPTYSLGEAIDLAQRMIARRKVAA